MSFTCPKCRMTSYNPNDERFGYCGNCHEWTGGYGYGHERHSSGSVEAQPDGTMQLREESEKTKAELSEVQGNGKNNGVRELRGSRMGFEKQQDVWEMRSDRLLVKPEYKPNVFRFYTGSMAVGITVGGTWLIGLEKFMTKDHAEKAMLLIVAAILIWQGIHLWQEHKRVKILEAALNEDWEEMKRRYPEVVNLEQYKVMAERRKKR